MSVIRTISGDIPPEYLGCCYSHEHLITDASYATQVFPDQCLNSVENAVKELMEIRDLGCSSVVEATPCGTGRNIRKLLEISKRSGIRVIATTGLQHDRYYPPGHWSRVYEPDVLADLFAAEIEEGIDEYDYGGPHVKRSSARAGIMKVASSFGRLTSRERELFRVAAKVHHRTGCPVMTHTEQGTAADEQLYLFREEGVDPGRIMMCHLDKKPDPAYHRELLRQGVTLEYDSAFRWKTGDENPTLELLKELLPEFPDQLVVGMDAGRPAYWKHYGGSPGLGYLLVGLKKKLEDALLDAFLLEGLFVRNPSRLLTFTNPKAGGTGRDKRK